MNICLVHCAPLVTAVLDAHLSSLGHNVLSYDSLCTQAADDDNICEPQVFIMSLRPPEMECLRILGEVRRGYPSIPLIAIMDAVFALSVKKEIVDGVYACIREPVHLENLETLLQQVSERRAAQTERSDS